jgi:3-phosphoshikimate 1-carboxyvinyltransferase
MSQSLAIQPISRFTASLRPPGSKSLTNRALLLAALAGGTSRLSNVLLADDSRVMFDALRKLGFSVELDEAARSVTVHGRGGVIPADSAELSLGNAGTAYRFLTAAVCLGKGVYTLDGVPRMRQRPIGQLVEPLRLLGAEVQCLGEEGYPPLRITADRLPGGELTLAPTLSSQYISALMQAGVCTSLGMTLRLEGEVTSLPYIIMTAELMKVFGAKVTIQTFEEEADDDEVGDRCTIVTAHPGGYRATDYNVEPDASNASYFLAAAAVIPGSVCTIEQLGTKSLQGDARFIEVLGQMGARIEATENYLRVTGPDRLRGVDIDLNDMPDTAQTLAVVALFADGPTAIRNVGNLRVKETDRLAALRTELTKLGAKAVIEGDDLIVTGPARLTPAAIDTYDDHRMAMSFAIAGLRSPGVRINDPSCVNKSFPEFWDYLQRLGATPAPAVTG